MVSHLSHNFDYWWVYHAGKIHPEVFIFLEIWGDGMGYNVGLATMWVMQLVLESSPSVFQRRLVSHFWSLMKWLIYHFIRYPQKYLFYWEFRGIKWDWCKIGLATQWIYVVDMGFTPKGDLETIGLTILNSHPSLYQDTLRGIIWQKSWRIMHLWLVLHASGSIKIHGCILSAASLKPLPYILMSEALLTELTQSRGLQDKSTYDGFYLH